MKVSIYIKFLIGIIIAMMSVFLVSVTIFLQNSPPDAEEFQVYPLIQRAKMIFSAEVNAAAGYVSTRGKKEWDNLNFLDTLFTQNIDTIRNKIKDKTFKQSIEKITNTHNSFRFFLSKISISGGQGKNGENLHDGALPVRTIDSVRAAIDEAIIAIGPGLSAAVEKYNTRRSDYIMSAVLILIAIVVITWGIARPYARSFVRPIRALREGTQKVGEGKYEAVPISSKDEIADLTQAFNLMSDKLRQLDEMRMQLMSEISHEMRTPLQVIKAGCYSIVHAKDSAQLSKRQRDAVGMIHQATNRINSFINLFLDVAKMESGLMKFNFEESSVLDILNPLLQEGELIAQTRQIELKLLAEDVPPVLIDKDRFSQAFSNLLSNALKYTPDSGTITVRIMKKAECHTLEKVGSPCLQIDVQDTGVGIPEADLSKLFSKFFQAKNVPLVNEKGSGLGLALVKHVIEAHGGKVSVESTVGVGSIFSLHLPLS